MDWEAWGAIFTALAAVVALGFGLHATFAEHQRKRRLRGVYATGMQLRLQQFIDQLEQVVDAARAYSVIDPNPKQVELLAAFCTHPRAVFTRSEALSIAELDTELAGSMLAMMEGADAVAGYVNETNRNFHNLRNVDRMDKMARAAKLAAEAITHARKALQACQSIISHPFRLPR